MKKRITADWLGQFTGLGMYKPLHLLRRVGPILEGIVLEGTSSDDEYRPAFHVHCLAAVFPAVTMTLAHPLRHEKSGARDWITLRGHESKYLEAAQRLHQQAPLPLEGDLRIGDVIEAYRSFANRPGVHYDAHQLYGDMARIHAWAGDVDQARAVLTEAAARLSGWPPNVLEQIGGASRWAEQLGRDVADPSRLRALADEQVEALGARTVPRAEMRSD